MKYKVEILPEADLDIDNFMIFLSKQFISKELLIKLRDVLYYKMYSLEFFPEIFAEVYKDYRRLLVKNYSIFYKVDNLNKKVIIYRILHQAQNFKKYLD